MPGSKRPVFLANVASHARSWAPRRRAEARTTRHECAWNTKLEDQPLRFCWHRLVLQRGRVGWTVFFLRALFAAEGLFGRNHPLKDPVFTDYALEEVSLAGNERERRAEKIRGVLRNSFLCLPTLNLVKKFSETWIRGTQPTDPRIALLNEAEQRHVG